MKVKVSQSQSIKVHGSETILRQIPVIPCTSGIFLGNPDRDAFLYR